MWGFIASQNGQIKSTDQRPGPGYGPSWTGQMPGKWLTAEADGWEVAWAAETHLLREKQALRWCKICQLMVIGANSTPTGIPNLRCRKLDSTQTDQLWSCTAVEQHGYEAALGPGPSPNRLLRSASPAPLWCFSSSPNLQFSVGREGALLSWLT